MVAPRRAQAGQVPALHQPDVEQGAQGSSRCAGEGIQGGAMKNTCSDDVDGIMDTAQERKALVARLYGRGRCLYSDNADGVRVFWRLFALELAAIGIGVMVGYAIWGAK
jgi:hypothetical protein